MSLDQDIRDALARHEADVRAAPDAFDGVEQRIRRNHRRRMAAASTFVVTLLVAAAASVVALRGEQAGPQDFSNPGDDPPAPTSSPTPHLEPGPGEVAFWETQAGFWVPIAEEWQITEFEGAIEILPPGQVGSAAGEDTFVVEIQLRMGEHYMDLVERPGDTSEGEAEIAGRPAYRVDYDGDDSPETTERRGVIWTVDWPSTYCRAGGCTSDPNTLMVHVFSSTADRWESYSEAALASVEAMQPVTRPSDLPAGNIRTRRGDVYGEVMMDDRTMTLVRFLEARVLGGGAESYLAERSSVDEADLYAVAGQPFFGHRVISCQDDGSSTTCFIALDFYSEREAARDEPHPSSAVEDITIGELDGKGPMVLAVERRSIEEGDGP